MVVYVVMDMMGEGRVAGVFDSEAAARHVVGEFPEYYKIHSCELNHLNPDVLGWSRNDDQHRWLQGILDGQ